MNAEETDALSAKERTVALVLIGAATLLRFPGLLHERFNSDEPQHLHVVWAWTRGLLPYRDVFDNHTPLFHVVMAPLLALVGERPVALILMRVAMVPLALLAIWLTYVVAARIYGRREATWSAVLLALHYEFFVKSIEFRTDNLWNVGWLATLAVIAGGRVTPMRALASGVALGATLCVSGKTVLMVFALAGAYVLVVALSDDSTPLARWMRAGRLATAAAAGFLAAPAAVWSYFATHGAGRAFVYAVITHNTLGGLGTRQEMWRPAALLVGLAVLALLARPRLLAAGVNHTHTLRVFLVLSASVYALALETVWPLVTSQDLLPLFGVLAIFIVRALGQWEARLRQRAPARRLATAAPAATLLALLAVETAVIVLRGPIWRDRTAAQTSLVERVLSLTDGGDPVMDTKGETIFRKRPFFWVLETITIERLRRGLIPDTIADDLVRSRCYVAVSDSERFPPGGRAFLSENFIPVGGLRVAGRFLRPTDGPTPRARFEIAIPGTYAVVTPAGPASGALDGTPYARPRALTAGPHEFAAEHGSGQMAVVWARAVEQGLSPFGRPRNAS